MMALVLRGRVSPLLCFVVIALIAGIGQAKSASGQLSVPELEDALQVRISRLYRCLSWIRTDL